MMPASRAFVHSDALWTRSCGAEETRTPDFLLAKEALYQLSYGPTRRSRVERSATERSGPDAWFASSPCRGGRFWTRTRDLCLIRAVL